MSVVDSNRPAAIPQPAKTPVENGTNIVPSAVPPAGLTVARELISIPPALSESSGTALLQALRRQWVRGLCLGLVASALAIGLTWFLFPPVYQAQALLHVASRAPKGVFSTENGYESSEDFTAYKGTQTTILKSRAVLEAVLKRPEFAELGRAREDDPVQWLEKNLQVDTLLGPEILRVVFSSERPEEAAALLNAIMDSYLKEILRKEQEKRQARMEQLQASVRNYEDILRKKRATLRELQDILALDDPQTLTIRFQSALTQEALVKQKLLTARMEVRNTQFDLAALKEALARPVTTVVSEAAVSEYMRQDPRAQKQLTLLSQVEEEIQKYKETVAPAFQSTFIALAEKRRTTALDALELRRREIRPLLEADLKAKQEAESKDKVRHLEGRLHAAQEETKALETESQRQEEMVKRWSAAINHPDKPTSDLEALRSELIAAEATQKKVTEQLEMLKVEPRVPSRVSLLASAQVPREKNYIPTIKGAGMAGMAVFGLLFIGAALPELRLRRIYRTEDIVHGLGLGVLGSLPAIPARARKLVSDRRSRKDSHRQTVLAESVDAIRTLLLHAGQTDSLKLIMVTSAGPGEGKTSLASQLAASLARAWRRTLLIDADLRNPTAHTLFDFPSEPGLSEVLRNESETDDVIRPTPLSRLWMMPAGHADAHAIQALAQRETRNIFERLKKQYDFVVVDSSPVLPVADSLSLGQHVDGVIVSVLLNVSRAPAVYAAVHRLQALGIRLLGTVATGAKSESDDVHFQYPPAASR